MLIDESSPHAAETLWLLRHAALSIQHRQPMPRHTRQALAARALSAGSNRCLLIALAHALRRPLALAPPCSSWRSRHEVLLLRAMAALEHGRASHARFALAELAAPLLLSRREIEGVCGLLARLSAMDPVASAGELS